MIKNAVLTCALSMMTLLITSCATLQPEQKAPLNANIPWHTRQQTLSNIQSWDFKAMIAVQHAQDSWSANLQWQQQKQNYHLAIFGPLGTHAYELTGQPGQVELAMANGKRYVANTPELLLAQQLGWHLPISSLYYWIRGLPVPNVPARQAFDDYYHLATLEQQGWTIRYLRYTAVNQLDIPNKIFLSNPQLRVKIVISEWHL